MLTRHGPLEAAEDAIAMFGVDADAMIAHGDCHGADFASGHAQLDRFAGAVLERVVQQVGDHLIEARAVPVTRHAFGQVQ
jgi:hypothetical protein